ncbi:MAG: helix-turn-helix transcriptional regulator [Clostridia bacterium]|nr:helix-turn-helix transcriptional regulator [Clostridia bacterium]
MASTVPSSAKAIARIIRKQYGITFSELVADKRLASAKMLLKNSDLAVREIAERTFPGSESYFYTIFKKKCGMSPLAYRERWRLH